MPSTSFSISCNYKQLVKEQANNNDEYAAVRELISNGCDALASNLVFGTLPDDSTQGLFFVDDGTGMPLWTGAEDSLKEHKQKNGEMIRPEDSKGRRCGAWASFFGFAFSTKDDRHGRTIGHKGQGAKLLLHCDKSLIVISKCIDDEFWGYVRLDNPIDGTSKSDVVEVKHYTSEEVEDDINKNTFLNAALNGDYSVLESGRLNELKNKVLKPFLKKKSGTFVIMMGITTKGLLDEIIPRKKKDFTHFDELPLYFAQNKKKQGSVDADDKSKLLTHIRFHTVVGHPFIKEAMISAGYDAEEIDHEIDANNNIFVHFDENREFDSTKHVPNFYVLNSGKNSKPELKKIPIGYPYIPKKSVPVDGSTHFPDRESNWAMQARYIASFKVTPSWRTGKGLMAGSRVTVACNIDGSHSRMGAMTMLGRKVQGTFDCRGGINNSQLVGVLIYSQGVYIGKCNKLITPSVMKKLPKWWHAFNKASSHWQIIIDGNFAVTSKRNELTTEGLNALTNDNVLKELKKILETFFSSKISTLKDIVKKMEKKNGTEMENKASGTWKKRITRVVEQPRFSVEVKENGGTAREYAFLEPVAGEENSVISIFSQLSGAIQDNWFDQSPALQKLKRFWPHIFSVTPSRGIDATGINRGSLEGFKSNDPISTSLIQQVEFKMQFRVPIKKPDADDDDSDLDPADDSDVDEDDSQDPKKKGTYTFNHEFIFTDFLICWDLQWEEKFQPGGAGSAFDLKGENVYAYDYIGCYGKICDKINHGGTNYEIPEAMRGYAFFISNLKNIHTNELVAVEIRRKHHLPFVTVFSLKRLIEVTFISGYGSLKWWNVPVRSNRRKRDEGGPGPSTQEKRAKANMTKKKLLEIIEEKEIEIEKLKQGQK